LPICGSWLDSYNDIYEMQIFYKNDI